MPLSAWLAASENRPHLEAHVFPGNELSRRKVGFHSCHAFLVERFRWHLWHREISCVSSACDRLGNYSMRMHEGDEGYCERGAQNRTPLRQFSFRAEQFMHISFKQFRKGVDAPFPNEINARPARRVGASTHPSICRTSSSPHAALLAGRRRTAFWRCRILAVRLSPAGSQAGPFPPEQGRLGV